MTYRVRRTIKIGVHTLFPGDELSQELMDEHIPRHLQTRKVATLVEHRYLMVEDPEPIDLPDPVLPPTVPTDLLDSPPVVRTRKPRSDKGKKQGPRTKRKKVNDGIQLDKRKSEQA